MPWALFYICRKRYEKNGLAGLRDQPRGPNRIQYRIPPEIVSLILRIREERRYGAVRTSLCLQRHHHACISPTTILKILHRHHVGRISRKKYRPGPNPADAPLRVTDRSVQLDVKFRSACWESASALLDGTKYTNKYYGRGYVQLTWKLNYDNLGRALGLGNGLVLHPEHALEPQTAYRIMSYGMRQGSFTGKKLQDYIHDESCDYFQARRIINALDKADVIQGYSEKLEGLLKQCLTAGGETAAVGGADSSAVSAGN